MRLSLPDLLATKRGRLCAFFLLYVTEGIPLGFTAVAIATQMRRQGLGPAEIGAFVASLYLPWAFKWAAGPFVDTFSSDRFGRRRLWILLMQIGMMGTLLAAMPLNIAADLGLLTLVILVELFHLIAGCCIGFDHIMVRGEEGPFFIAGWIGLMAGGCCAFGVFYFLAALFEGASQFSTLFVQDGVEDDPGCLAFKTHVVTFDGDRVKQNSRSLI